MNVVSEDVADKVLRIRVDLSIKRKWDCPDDVRASDEVLKGYMDRYIGETTKIINGEVWT